MTVDGEVTNFTVEAGGVLSGAGSLSGTGNGVYGTISGLNINNANEGVFIYSGGVGSGLTTSAQDYSDANSRGIYAVSGGVVVNTIVGSAGSLDLDAGGVASNTVVQAGGYLNGTAGSLIGVTSNAGVISNGQVSGTVIVQAGGFDGGDNVLAGGVESVALGAITEDFTVEVGGVLSGGGSLSGTGNSVYGTISGLNINTGNEGVFIYTGGVGSGLTASRPGLCRWQQPRHLCRGRQGGRHHRRS